MDVKKYTEKKAKGLAALAKVGGAYAMSQKRFDPETGEALASEVAAVDKAELQKQKADLQAQITNIDAVLADITALG